MDHDLGREVEGIARRSLGGPKRPSPVVPDFEHITDGDGARCGGVHSTSAHLLEHGGRSAQNNPRIRVGVGCDSEPYGELRHLASRGSGTALVRHLRYSCDEVRCRRRKGGCALETVGWGGCVLARGADGRDNREGTRHDAVAHGLGASGQAGPAAEIRRGSAPQGERFVGRHRVPLRSVGRPDRGNGERHTNIGCAGINRNEATAPLTAQAGARLEEAGARHGRRDNGEECSHHGLRQIGHGPILGSLPYANSTGPSVTVVSVSVTVSVILPSITRPTNRAGCRIPRSTGWAVMLCSPGTSNRPFASGMICWWMLP